MMSHEFQIGDFAVCSGHGVGQVCDIKTNEIGGTTMSFYSVKIISNGMVVMVPTNKPDSMRPLIENSETKKVYSFLSDHDVEVDQSTWNRRYRDYMAKIKTGSIYEIADVLRSLFILKTRKNLSFGEKKMLDQCKNMIVEEIALVEGNDKKEVDQQIQSCFE
jgi:CarD family transcriptional regulator